MLVQLLRGKSLQRSLMNLEARRRVSLEGVVLDLGSGHQPSYWEYLVREKPHRVVKIDRHPYVDIWASLEDPLPFRDEAVDRVLCFNVLEHLFDYTRLVQEVHRVLRNGGIAYVYVPFLINVHSDPQDYFRYTEEALRRILGADGRFSNVTVRPLGAGAFTAAANLLCYAPRVGPWLQILWAFPALWADGILQRLQGEEYCRRWPLGYFVEAVK